MLSINFTNCLVDSIGLSHGLTEPELFGLEPRLKDAHDNVMRQANAGKLGFVDLPNNSEEAKKIMSWARKVKAHSIPSLFSASAAARSAISQFTRRSGPLVELKRQKHAKDG